MDLNQHMIKFFHRYIDPFLYCLNNIDELDVTSLYIIFIIDISFIASKIYFIGMNIL